jgi:transposase-like protein
MSNSQVTVKERASVLRRLDASGQSMAEFCREHGLAYGTVATWRAAARRQPAVDWLEVETVKEEAPRMVRGTVVEVGELSAELSLPGGVVLRIYREERGC